MEKKIIALETRSLDIGYSIASGRKKIVQKSLHLELEQGKVTSLLGLNGAGKSTLIKTLCGFNPSLGGDILVYGKSLKDYSTSELALVVGVVLTDKTNAGGISVYDLVSLGRHPYTGFFGRLTSEDHLVIDSALRSVGMIEKSSSYISELSDGERQKVMIAKVLAQGSSVIILDEPTAFLDITSRVEMMILLRKLASEQSKAIILSTHDIDNALTLSDNLWLLDKQAGLIAGSPEQLIKDGSIGRVFDKEGIVFDPDTGKFRYFI